MMNTQRWPRGAAPLLHPPCRNCLQSDKGTEGELDLTKVFCLMILLFCHTSVSHCGTKVKMYAGPIIIIFAFSLLVAFLLCQVAPFLFPFSFQLHNLCSFWCISRTTWVLTGHFYRHLSALAGATSEEEADWAGGEAGCWWEGGLQRRGRPCTPGRGASCQIKRNHKYEREEKTLISYVGEGGEKVGHQSWISRLMTMNALHIYAMHINIWKTSTPVWTFKPFCPTCESFTNIAL